MDPSAAPPASACGSAAVRPVAVSGWSPDFRAWMAAHGLAHVAANQGWGGGTGCASPIGRDPVILLHGNSFATDPTLDFAAFRMYALAAGYTTCDLYAITWIERNLDTGANHHRGAYAQLIRDFIAAVRGYTGRPQVDVVAWSMGVTMARKAILGGVTYEDPGRSPATACDRGPSLADQVHTFVGVAGANRGLSMCAGSSSSVCSENGLQVDAAFLRDVNGGWGGDYAPAPLASQVYSLVLPDDGVICGQDPGGLGPFPCEVFGVHTSQIPGETFSRSYDVPNAPSGAPDHLLVFMDQGALEIMLRLVRDNDTGA